MSKASVSFVVLNWNGLSDTLKCLESIRRQSVKFNEIIVVDNGSSEEQKNELRKIKDIVYVDLPKNTGFTGGQLAGIKKATGKFIALINNDAVLDEDWALKAVQAFKEDHKAAAVGGKAFRWNDQDDLPLHDTNNPFYSYQVVDLSSGHTRTLTYGDDTAYVDSISGAAVMIRRSAIDKVGYFDNRFFAYYEETDLFARFIRAGYKILYDPGLLVWHKIAQSTSSKPDFFLYFMHRNRFLFAVKNYDFPYLLAFFRNYTKEWFRALARVVRHGAQNSIEEKNLVRAGLWNALHIIPTLYRRRGIRNLGPVYSEKLLANKAESIAVVIPSYNYGQFVGKAVDSVLDQTRRPDEIIVIDDGSTDDSYEILKKYGKKINLIRQKNQGVIATKNRGIKESSSDWIIFLDADDAMDKSYIGTLYDEARRKSADIVYSGMRLVGSEKAIFTSRPFTLRSLKKGNYINNSALMRKDLLEKVGGYKSRMSFGYEDWELYVALGGTKAKFRHVSKPLLYYRRHGSNSRDLAAQKKLHQAHELVRSIHPELFTFSHRIRDLFFTLFTFHQRRTPWQLLKDLRYTFIKKIDSLGERSMAVNKSMGFLRLLSSGRFSTISSKIRLNFRRLFH